MNQLQKKKNMYGKEFKDLNTKKKIFSKNHESLIFYERDYSLYKIKLKKNQIYSIKNKAFFIYPIDNIFFVNNSKILEAKNKIIFSKKNFIFKSLKNDYLFVFFQSKKKIKIIKNKKLINKKQDFLIKKIHILQKYWGEIITLFSNNNGAAKIIRMTAGSQSSMEFHIKKIESYYINYGLIKLGIRFGRAKQKIVNLYKNYCFLMKPGTMHMRISKIDSEIIEMSNKDCNSDSIIVQDGTAFKFKEVL